MVKGCDKLWFTVLVYQGIVSFIASVNKNIPLACFLVWEISVNVDYFLV